MFRKTIAIFFVLLSLLPILVTTLFYGARIVIRYKMEQALEKQQLCSIEVNTLVWYENGKELMINNTLFDVNSITKTKHETYLVTGLFDFQEKKLHTTLDIAMQKNKSHSFLFKGIFSFLFTTYSSWTLIYKNFETKDQYFVANIKCDSQHIKPILSPPPQATV